MLMAVVCTLSRKNVVTWPKNRVFSLEKSHWINPAIGATIEISELAYARAPSVVRILVTSVISLSHVKDVYTYPWSDKRSGLRDQ